MVLFLELLQVALGRREKFSRIPTTEEWHFFVKECKRQAVAAFVFPALDILNKIGQKAPVGVVYEWLAISEQVKVQNELMNREAARLTSLFEKERRKTVMTSFSIP